MSAVKRSFMDWTTLVLLLLIPTWLAVRWSDIPARVPLHFNLAGHTNRTGSRTELWILPVMAAVIYVLITVVMRYPGSMNLPAPPGDSGRPRMEQMGVELLLWLRLLLVAGFAWTTLLLSGGVTGKGQPAPIWTLALLPVCLVVLVGAFQVRMMRQG